MPPQFLVDECLRDQRFFFLLLRLSAPIDFVRVGDPGGPPLGSDDEFLLQWCEAHDRIFVSHDRTTVPDHLAEHLLAGRHSPGVFLVRPDCEFSVVADYLSLVAHCSNASEWIDQLIFIPQ